MISPNKEGKLEKLSPIIQNEMPPAISRPNNNEIALIKFANESKGIRKGITELKHKLAGYGPSRVIR